MEEIYANVDYNKPVDPTPSTNQTGPRSSERRLHGAVVLCLGLLSVVLLVGLIILGVTYRDLAAEHSTIKANLTELLQASNDKLSSVSEERDLLNANLTSVSKELDTLQSLSKQNRDLAAEHSIINANLTERLQASNDKLSSVSEERDLLKANLTERLQASNDKLSSVSEERDLLNANLTSVSKELDTLQSLSKQNRDLAAEHSSIKAILTERLQASNDKLSSVSEERDLLNANLTSVSKELDTLQSLSKQKRTCPAEWKMFSCTCYLFSNKTDYWENGRQDCRDRGAELVTIDTVEEQEFISKTIKADNWIGLNDREEEGTWKWIDGTPLTVGYWREDQPDNGLGDPQWGEEDCVHIKSGVNAKQSWNDLRCDTSLQWICAKMPQYLHEF
ncbi:C-type lectin domain family 10 member A-like isoform X1 [Sparus aurata]|uniref:C-type lectin domain family 10 member A-like isoform X1 n=1 Tax=Sparus aurata TaxID=8175 RepID=UPI0011C14DEE|nr:C-type lectin domain family 10 member A-like isoform X1 [Sparus aurata]